MPIFDEKPFLESPFVNKQFVSPSALDQVDMEKVASASAVFYELLSQKDKLKNILRDEDKLQIKLAEERIWTKSWREKFYFILDSMNRPDTRKSLDYLLVTFQDLSDTAGALDLPRKIMEWPNLAQPLSDAAYVAQILLGALHREQMMFNKDTEQISGQKYFNEMTTITNEDGKKPAPSSIELSARNIDKGRNDLFRERWAEIGEQIDYVQAMYDAILRLYDMLKQVSIQNQGLNKQNISNGA